MTTKNPLVSAGGVTLHLRSRRAVSNGQATRLTSHEFEILELLVRHSGELITREQLLRKTSPVQSERALEVHISRLRKKLALGPDRIRAVRGVGYVFCEEDTAAVEPPATAAQPAYLAQETAQPEL